MIVPLSLKKDDCEDDTPREWSLIELNGELLPPKQLPSNESSVELGAFEYDAEVRTSFVCNAYIFIFIDLHISHYSMHEFCKCFLLSFLSSLSLLYMLLYSRFDCII